MSVFFRHALLGTWRGIYNGQECDLRTMEPVSDIIGHCFVVGARHQLRASMSGWRGRAPMPGRFAQAPMLGRWRGREAMPGRHQPAEPSQSPGSLLYVLYVLYGSHKAAH